MPKRGRALLCAVLLVAAIPAGGHAQVFLATQPHPDFAVGPLIVVVTVRPDLGPVNVSITFSLTTPPGQHPAEIKQDMERTRAGVALTVTGTCLSLIGALLLGFAVAHLCHWSWPGAEIWVWYAVVGGLFAGVGAAVVGVVLTRIKKAKPLSETAAGIEETVEWKTKTPK